MATRTVRNDSVRGRIIGGQVVLDDEAPWTEGTVVEVCPRVTNPPVPKRQGHVIIAGFGLAGRCVAELLANEGIAFTIVERNRATVATQESLGRRIVFGDITDKDTLIRSGLIEASALALTIPDEDGVLRATSLARQLNPKVYIIARTNYSSKGLEASKLGADDVVKAEQAVALQFRDRIRRRFRTDLPARNGDDG